MLTIWLAAMAAAVARGLTLDEVGAVCGDDSAWCRDGLRWWRIRELDLRWWWIMRTPMMRWRI